MLQKGSEDMNMAGKTDLRPAVIEDRPYLYQSMACSDATPEMMGLPRFPDHPVPDYPTFCEDFDDAAFADEGSSRPFIITTAGRDIGAACYTIRGRFAELDIWIAARRDWGQGHGIRALEQLITLLDAAGLIDGAIMRPSARNARAIAVYRKAGFVLFDNQVHQLPAWCLDGGEDYTDAVVMVRLIQEGGDGIDSAHDAFPIRGPSCC